MDFFASLLIAGITVVIATAFMIGMSIDNYYCISERDDIIARQEAQIKKLSSEYEDLKAQMETLEKHNFYYRTIIVGLVIMAPGVAGFMLILILKVQHHQRVNSILRDWERWEQEGQIQL